jgi:SAM-dependent methyltransferase
MSSFQPTAYWEERLRANFDWKGVGFTSLGRNYNRWMYRLRRKVFLRAVDSIPLKWETARVLDIGSGTGFYVELWKQLGVQSVAGCDLTNFAVHRLRQTYPDEKFIQLDIGEELKCEPSETYDAISAFDVLFHIVDDHRFAQAIANVHKLLSPGGWFLFSELFVHGNALRAWHQVSRSLDEIEKILRQTGFVIEARRPAFVLMNLPLDISSKWPQFFWKAAMVPVRRSEWVGFAMGAALFWLDSLLTALFSESPTTEVMVCRKADGE